MLKCHQLLDSFTYRTHIVHLAEQYFRSFPNFELAVYFLCKWATALERTRGCRIALVITLLKHAVGVEGNTMAKEQVQAHLLKWFDDEMEFGADDGIYSTSLLWPSDAARTFTSILGLASRSRFFGELIDAGICNYAVFLQRLVARGDLEGRRRYTEVGFCLWRLVL